MKMKRQAMVLFAIALVCTSVTAADEDTCFGLLDEDSQQFAEGNEEIKTALSNEIETAYFVYNLAQGEDDYFLVNCNNQLGTTAIVKIDATGAFEGYTWMEPPVKYLPVSKNEAIAMIKQIINPQTGQGIEIDFDYNITTRIERQSEQSPWKPYWILQASNGEWVITQTGVLNEINVFTAKTADTNVVELEEVPESTKGFLVAGKFYEITNSDLNNGSFEAMLTFSYDDVDSDGIVDGTEINETELNVYYYNIEIAKWIIVPEPEIDTEANTISVTVNHFTTFMLAALEPPAPQPTPPQDTDGGTWMSNGGPGGGSGTAKLGMKIEENCAGKEITITVLNPSNNPTENATITIYTRAWKTMEEQKSNEKGKTIFVLETGEYTIRATKSGYMVNTKQITVEECRQEETIEEPEVQNNNTLQENQTETEETQTQEQQNLGQTEKEQTTTMQTGLFSLEGNNKKTITAAMAGIVVAMLVGAALYIKKRIKKKQN